MRNTYKVSKRQWAKWNENARNVFNTVYQTIGSNQYLYMHEDASVMSSTHWHVVAWNAAFIAACAVAE